MTAGGPRVMIVLSLVLASVAAALHQTPRRARAFVPAPRVPAVAARCALRGVQARDHARALEHRSTLRWQRAPFEASEATRASQLIAEAEACYRAAGDRGGAQRAASRHRRYAAEVSRRDAALEIARLRTAPRARAADARWVDESEVEP
jgi:hypothetical protein